MRGKQELFDFVCSSVIKQGRPSYSIAAIPHCRYRGPNGTKCAVGMLIPDDVYTYKMEGDVEDLLNFCTDKGIEADWVEEITEYKEMLTDIQKAHDDAAPMDDGFVEAFKDNIRKMVFENLDLTVVSS